MAIRLSASGGGLVLWMMVTLATCASSGGPGGRGAVNGDNAQQASDPLPPLIPREIFFEDPEISGGQISPDGKFISFRRPYQGVLNIWVKLRQEPLEAARPVTAVSKRPVSEYFWSEDSRYLLFLNDASGGSNDHLYVVEPGAALQANAAVPPARDLTPVAAARAQLLALPEVTPDTVVVGLNDRDPKFYDVYRLEIRSGKRKLVFRNDASIVGWTTDLKGTLRLAQRITPDGGKEILRVDGARLTQVYACNQEETCAPLRFHPDGRRVYMTTNRGRPDLSRLVLLDLASKHDDVVETDPEPRVDFGSADFSDATEGLVATNYQADRLRTYPHDEQFRRAYDLVRAAVPDGDIRFVSSSEDDRYRLVSIVSDLDPGATYLYDHVTGKVELQYRPRPRLPTQHLSGMRSTTYDTRDGNTIQAYLTVPKGAGCRNMPAIVVPHEGPWARDVWGYNALVQFLANRGYLVLQPNYRGSTGFGKKWVNIGNKQWGTGTMQNDLSDGALWLGEQKFADPKRIAILGGAYGGYAALAAVAFRPQIWAAAVDIAGPASLPTWVASIPAHWESMRHLFTVRVGDPADPEQLGMLKAQSPLYAATKIKAPVLMIQSAGDARVRPAESEAVVAAVRDAGQPVEYLLTRDDGGGAASQENRIAMFAAIERFLGRHLGGRVESDVKPAVAQRLAAMTIDVSKLKAKDETALASDGPAAPSVVQPAFVGAALRPATLRYVYRGETQGHAIEGSSIVTIAAGKRDKRAVWTIDEQSQTGEGSATDTTVVDRKTLVPLDRTVRQPDVGVDLAFSNDEISGQVLKADGQDVPIHSKSDGTVLTDGMPLNLALATLPLKAGYVAQVRSFAPTAGRAQLHYVVVKGVESLDTPAGKLDAFRVLVAPVDALAKIPDARDMTVLGVLPPAGSSLVWIEQATPRRILRWELILADGKLRAELVLGGGGAGKTAAALRSPFKAGSSGSTTPATTTTAAVLAR